MARLPLDAREVIGDAMANCDDPIERGFMARQMAERYACTLQTVYRHFPVGRRKRADAGQRKIQIENAAVENIMALLVQSDGNVSLADAMVVSGVDGLSLSSIRREMKRRGFTHKRIGQSRRAFRRWRAAFSNQLHQADDTVSRLYYVHKSGKIRRYGGGVGPYRNRPKDRLVKLYLMVLKDDHSGVIYARYYIGKHSANWLDFFFRAWSPKRDMRYRLFGVPDAIYTDQDGVFKSNLCTRALAKERLGVETKRTLPYSPESKGKVENAIGHMARRFESLIEFFPPEFDDVDALNQALEDYCLYRGWKKSRAVGMEPFRVWERDLPADRKLRLMPDEEIRRHLLMERESRVIDSYLELRLKDREGVWHYYSLDTTEATRALANQRVEICHFSDDYSCIYVSHDEKEYMIAESPEPYCNEMGEYKGGRINPENQVILDAATRKAVAIPRFRECLPAAANLARIDPTGEVIESVMFDREPELMPPMLAQDKAEALMMKRAGRECTHEERCAFHERFQTGSTLTMDQVTAWVEEILTKGVEDEGTAAAIAG